MKTKLFDLCVIQTPGSRWAELWLISFFPLRSHRLANVLTFFSQHHHFNFVYMEFFNAKQYFSLTIHFAQHILHFDFWIEENIHTLTVHGCHSFQFYFATIRKIIFAHLNILLNPVPTINEMQLSVFFFNYFKGYSLYCGGSIVVLKAYCGCHENKKIKNFHVFWSHLASSARVSHFMRTHTLPILIGYQEITTSQAGGFIFLLQYVCHVHTKICMW